MCMLQVGKDDEHVNFKPDLFFPETAEIPSSC